MLIVIFTIKKNQSQGSKRIFKATLTKKQSVIFMAYEDAKAVGFTKLYPSYSSVNMASLWVLSDLFVDPRHRGKKSEYNYWNRHKYFL